MSRKNSRKRALSTHDIVVNSSIECNSTPHKRRRETNRALEVLERLIRDPSLDDPNNKLNKNDTLGLTLARLLRLKYWNSSVPNRNVELLSDIESFSTIDDLNGFIVVCNTNGRIILMSDHIEDYLRKNVRLLYPQLTSIYKCVSEDDHASIRHMLLTPTNTEQQIICTWHLPRGKRPSRNQTESKTMLMTGHFFTINNEENRQQYEPLFIARCEQILSSTPNIPTSCIGSTSSTTLRFVLTDQLLINEISSNTPSLLGYKVDELIDQSLNRIVAAEYINILEKARLDCILQQHHTTMEVLDLWNSNGDRLTFLCNIHTLIEGRRKTIKLGFLAQLIDPMARDEFIIYSKKQNLERSRNIAIRKSTSMSSMDATTSPTTNILSPKPEKYIDLSNISSVYPAMILPQRRKRRRALRPKIKNVKLDFIDKAQQAPQISNDFYDSYISSSGSVTSSASPIQEIGSEEVLQSVFGDFLKTDTIEPIIGLPSIEDVFTEFGKHNDQQCVLLTPTMPGLNFVY